MMLKDYAKTLYEVNRDNTRYCVISASIVDRSLHIHRTDYQEWEYNSRTGIVEGLDTLDEENTKNYVNVSELPPLQTLFGFLNESSVKMVLHSFFPIFGNSAMTTI